ncbi:MAG: DNA polymerase I [Bacteroidetes bacterium GWF2_38_335]|nr:MAG: DNA polymerase I [Bacteroidetes bacterium GWF2_38_335]OFY77081.1 MAG: DNA polymerase I [Bacteroidetes bacterium RIFOXYA12_FULL_38_20]HBS84971.1 DNA polymerase I [Bacteroidales bacterium]
MKKLFLLDAYALIYRAYYAFIKNPRINSKGLNTSAIFGFTNTLIEVLQKEKPSHIAIVFDPPGPSFRVGMFSAYKANRPPSPEEIKLSVPWIKKMADAFCIKVVEIPTFEADDTIGTLAKKAEKEGFEVFMMTPDKDFAQLLSDKIFMFKPKRMGNETEIIGIKELPGFFGVEKPSQVIDVLTLWGDASDNIPGAPGIGEKTARKLIAEFGDLDNLFANLHKLQGRQKESIEKSIDLLKLSRQLATINLNVPVDFNEEDYRLVPANREKLKAVLEELEFRNMLGRMIPLGNETASVQNKEEEKPVPAAKTRPAMPSGPMQGSLFFDDDFKGFTPPAPSNMSSIENVKHEYHLADTEEKRKSLIDLLLKQKEISFDTETTNIDPNMADLVGMSFAYRSHEAWYVPVPAQKTAAQMLVEEFKPLLENENICKIGQNIKYDMIVMKWYGVEIRGKIFDTMLAHYLLNPELIHNMNYLAENYLNYRCVTIESLIGKKGADQINMRSVPVEKVKDYAAEDADITFQLKEYFEPELEKAGLLKLFNEIETPLVPVLAEIEKTGVWINSDDLDRYAVVLREEIIKTEAHIFSLAGTEFNISSPKQLGEILFDRLKIESDGKKSSKSGQYSTSEDVLEKLMTKHPIIVLILDYRSLRKLLSTYIEALPRLINPRTGKIHASFNQAVTTTGRLSSNNPNLQNIPIREERGREIRKAFVPSKGNVFLSADYSQVELRIMAHLSGDPSLIEAFSNNEDIHTATAAKINKISPDKVTKEMRSRAKSANFGIIYGISAFGLAQNLNLSRSEAKNLIDSYFESYPKVKEYMDQSIAKARDNGFVETIFNRRRNLQVINSKNPTVRGNDERNAINAPIQGSAADIIKIAMIRIFERFNKENLKAKMILQVHDELDFDVPENELKQVEQIVKEEMENAVKLAVPLTVETGFGKNWLEAH